MPYFDVPRYAMRWEPANSDRWNTYFEGNVQIEPWIPARPEGYALLLGQVPTDTAVVNSRLIHGSIDAAYK